jgi:hypothetical protein
MVPWPEYGVWVPRLIRLFCLAHLGIVDLCQQFHVEIV